MKHSTIVKRLTSLQITFDGIRKCVKSCKDKIHLHRNLIKCISDFRLTPWFNFTSKCNIRYIYRSYFVAFVD